MNDKEKSEKVEKPENEKPENGKPENGKSKINRIRQAERDGMTGDRITWGERLAHALQPFGTEKQGLWFTHKAARKRLQDHTGLNDDEIPALGNVLYDLVKCGYVDRALKPEKMTARYAPRAEYIYRRTSKPFKRKTFDRFINSPSASIGKGFQTWLDHGRLPKWFREMMK